MKPPDIFKRLVGTFSGRVCGDRARHFTPKDELLLTPSTWVFLPNPDESVSTVTNVSRIELKTES